MSICSSYNLKKYIFLLFRAEIEPEIRSAKSQCAKSYRQELVTCSGFMLFGHSFHRIFIPETFRGIRGGKIRGTMNRCISYT